MGKVLIVVAVPLILFVFGLLLWKYPPKDVNSFYGFRTRRSSKTQKNWDCAQKRCAKAFLLAACISIILNLLGYLFYNFAQPSFVFENLAYLSLIPLVVLIVSIFRINYTLPD